MLQSALRSTGSEFAQLPNNQPVTFHRVPLSSCTLLANSANSLNSRRPLARKTRPSFHSRRQTAICSTVVDRPQEADLQSTGLGWPKGFHNRYVLREQLGRGSFGTVYLATEKVSGQEVAAKIIPKERKGTTTERILEKIQQEVVGKQQLSDMSRLQKDVHCLCCALYQGLVHSSGGCLAPHARSPGGVETHISI